MPRGIAHAWKVTGGGTGRILFLYTPGAAGKMFVGSHRLPRSVATMAPDEIAELFRRHRTGSVGPAPF
jgi:hypothetical protein